ncbi:ParA family protein [Halomarina pelagica]|uniref:ParA family protein n=1 Tax=Halomarina pelagica TaxID=2961599 RepID=UPI0020C24F6D|nr:hypothetical protein [Halomarina sp. BND7]
MPSRQARRDDFARMHETLGVEIELAMLLPNEVDVRTTADQAFLDALAEEFGDVLAPAHVPRSKDI